MNSELARIRSGSTVALVIAAGLLTWTASLDAYVDPGSGSLLVQLLLGGLAGVGVAIRVYWRRITSRFGNRKTQGNPSEGR